MFTFGNHICVKTHVSIHLSLLRSVCFSIQAKASKEEKEEEEVDWKRKKAKTSDKITTLSEQNSTDLEF